VHSARSLITRIIRGGGGRDSRRVLASALVNISQSVNSLRAPTYRGYFVSNGSAYISASSSAPFPRAAGKAARARNFQRVSFATRNVELSGDSRSAAADFPTSGDYEKEKENEKGEEGKRNELDPGGCRRVALSLSLAGRTGFPSLSASSCN